VDCLPKKLPLQAFKDALVEELLAKEKNVKHHEFTAEEISAIEKIKKDRYDTWEWNYGKSPKYDIVKERYIDGCGKFEIHMNVKEGTIENIDILVIISATETKQILSSCSLVSRLTRKVSAKLCQK